MLLLRHAHIAVHDKAERLARAEGGRGGEGAARRVADTVGVLRAGVQTGQDGGVVPRAVVVLPPRFLPAHVRRLHAPVATLSVSVRRPHCQCGGSLAARPIGSFAPPAGVLSGYGVLQREAMASGRPGGCVRMWLDRQRENPGAQARTREHAGVRAAGGRGMHVKVSCSVAHR